MFPLPEEHIINSESAKKVWAQFFEKYDHFSGASKNSLFMKEEVAGFATLPLSKRIALRKVLVGWKKKTSQSRKILLDLRNQYPNDVRIFFQKQYDEAIEAIKQFLKEALGFDSNELKVNEFLSRYKRWLWENENETELHFFIKKYYPHLKFESRIVRKLEDKLKLIHRDINFLKLEKLYHAISKGDYSDSIFQDSDLPYLSLSLYCQGRIHQTQFYTIMCYQVVDIEFGVESAYQMFDEKGELTNHAYSYLLTYLKISPGNPINQKQLNAFSLLVRELPASERIYYLSPLKPKYPMKQGTGVFNLSELEAVSSSATHYCHLSVGAMQALQLIRFGIAQYVISIPRLGVSSIDDIEESIRKGYRLSALSYPYPKIWHNVHESSVYEFALISHDIAYHATLMSAIPVQFRKLFIQLVDIVRSSVRQSKPSFRWSRDIWAWVDSDFYFFYISWQYARDFVIRNEVPPQDFLTTMLSIFKHYVLEQSGHSQEHNAHYAGSLFVRGSYRNSMSLFAKEISLSCAGLIGVLAMIEKPSDWNFIDLKSTLCVTYLGKYINEIGEIQTDIKGFELRKKLLSVYIYHQLCQIGAKNEWPHFLECLSVLSDDLIEFVKAPVSNRFSPNTLFLKLAEHIIDEDNVIRYLFKHLCKSLENKDNYLSIYALFIKEKSLKKCLMLLSHMKSMSFERALFTVAPNARNWVAMHPCASFIAAMTGSGLPVLGLFASYQISAARKQISDRPIAKSLTI